MTICIGSMVIYVKFLASPWYQISYYFYSGYAGPPSVASSYHQDDMNQEMSHVDHHQISHQDDQWAKATGQDISGLSFNVSLTLVRNLFS